MENAVKNGILGILAAMDEECAPVLKRMNLAEEGKIGNALYWKGTLGGTEIVLVRCGVGRIKAAAAVAEMCRRFSVRIVLSIGTCGGLDPELQVGDVILASSIVTPSEPAQNAAEGTPAPEGQPAQNAAEGTPAPEGQLAQNAAEGTPAPEERPAQDTESLAVPASGELPARNGENVGSSAENADDAICRAYEDVCQLEHTFTCRKGTILTVDKALATEESKARARQDYGADVVDMETAAIAKAAVESGVAWAVVRVVSDSASENLPIDFGSIMGADGEPDRVRLAVKAIMKPPLMLKLLKLRTAMNRAVGNMADCLEELAVKL
ncbi:MAG: 5'-methylthioadenosine/S-adenosylhomocysteine nucleosidase [bacterium]|nr:5'-methylthioadenosine/S-adenosylhomocysteine nucleosidase [bacterium]